MDIKGKIGIITGGTGGIGLAVVKELLRNGIKFIAILDLAKSDTKEIVNELVEEHGPRVAFYHCDVTNNAELSENFNKIMEDHHAIDILINNAGIGNENSPERMIDINCKAVILGSLMMIDRMGKHKGGKGGVIINTASILGLVNYKMPIYCATKHAVVSFTRCMAEPYDNTGVRVIAICPGFTDTPIISEISNGLDFIHHEVDLAKYVIQPTENVARAIIQMIESGKSGDVWVSEKNEPPYTVKSVEDYRNWRED